MAWTKIEGTAYWTLFVATFLAVAVWESFQPKRGLSFPAERRWGRNGMLLAISAVLQTAAIRTSPVVLATVVAGSHFGILNKPWLPFPVRCAAAIIVLDLLHYGTHKIFHRVPFLWRVHEVHHSDPDYDVSTAARFHPLEVVPVQGATLAAIGLLAPPPVAVFASELLVVVLNFFTHANASVPPWAEKLLRGVIITPDMHRTHHSAEAEEQSFNLGQTFSWWDRLFGTYLAKPAAGEEGLATGIKGLQDGNSLGLGFMLAEPFQPRRETQNGQVL